MKKKWNVKLQSCTAFAKKKTKNLLVVDPGGSQCLLKLGEAHDIDVDELNHLVTLGGATGLVPHDPAHDPEN